MFNICFLSSGKSIFGKAIRDEILHGAATRDIDLDHEKHVTQLILT